ncbi:DUF4185 domain-containing protein [bacterium]|nr:DUF4185 domain-containing protein [candidate division CSSED10-310 bacterium]
MIKACGLIISIVWIAGLAHPVNGQIIDPWFCGDGICQAFTGETATTCPDDCVIDPVIVDAWIENGPYVPIPTHGDLWFASWADDESPDGRLVMTWGDGCGVGVSWGEPACDEFNWDTDVTDAGFFMADGVFPDIQCVEEAGECFMVRNIPDGISGYPHTPDDDKPAGIIALDGTIVMAIASPQRSVEEGYLISSSDWGQTWNTVPGTPWTMESPASHRSRFRYLMFIQMGKNYSDNTDGYVYALGIGWGWNWDFIGDDRVYLCRVPRQSVTQYDAYEYCAGIDAGLPVWSPDEEAAKALEGLYFGEPVNVVYHPYIQRFLCLTHFGLYEALNPWGPWILSARVLNLGDHEDFWGSYSIALMPKDIGPDSIWFTSAGRTVNVSYRMNLACLHLEFAPGTIDSNPIPRPWIPRPLPPRHTRQPHHPLPVQGAEGKRTLLTEGLRVTGQVDDAAVDAGNQDAEPAPIRADRSAVVRVRPNSEMTIQQAIDTVADGGAVLLSPGRYTGTGNTNIMIDRSVDIIGEGLFGACIIDGERRSGGMTVREVSGNGVFVRNVVFRDCYRVSPGGAIAVMLSNARLDQVMIEGCGSFIMGGGLSSYESNVTWLSGTVSKCFCALGGGGMATIWRGNLACMDVEFTENTSCLYGGALMDIESDTLFSNCRFSDCHAVFGGAVKSHQSCGMRYENCLMEANSARISGGAIHYFISIWPLCDSNHFHLLNCTLRDNTAGLDTTHGMGGAIFSAYSPDDTLIQNSIMWGNTADIGNQVAFDGIGFIGFQHSLVQDGYDGIFRNGEFNWVLWGDGMVVANPLFAMGPFGTSYLSRIDTGQPVNSPAIDSGHDLSTQVVYGIPGIRTYTLADRTTAIDHRLDDGEEDLGAHYQPLQPVPFRPIAVIVLCLAVVTWVVFRSS